MPLECAQVSAVVKDHKAALESTTAMLRAAARETEKKERERADAQQQQSNLKLDIARFTAVTDDAKKTLETQRVRTEVLRADVQRLQQVARTISGPCLGMPADQGYEEAPWHRLEQRSPTAAPPARGEQDASAVPIPTPGSAPQPPVPLPLVHQQPLPWPSCRPPARLFSSRVQSRFLLAGATAAGTMRDGWVSRRGGEGIGIMGAQVPDIGRGTSDCLPGLPPKWYCTESPTRSPTPRGWALPIVQTSDQQGRHRVSVGLRTEARFDRVRTRA